MSTARGRGRYATGRAAHSRYTTGRGMAEADRGCVTAESGPGGVSGPTRGRHGAVAGRGRGAGADRGSATAELAASLPAIVLLLVFGLTAVDAVGTQTRCVDAARDVALALSRGEPRRTDHLPPGGSITVHSEGERIAVTVTAPVIGGWRGGLTVSGRAVAAVETS